MRSAVVGIEIGSRADKMLDLTGPEPGWIMLAEGFGVEAARAATAGEFRREFGQAMREPAPKLIEAVLS
jgi:acetolactate synthase-1/2/3 large subunit